MNLSPASTRWRWRRRLNWSPRYSALPESRADVATSIVSGLAAGWPANKPPKLSEVLRETSANLAKPPRRRGQALKLASTWGVKGIDAQLAEITKAAFATLADVKARDTDRVAAAQQVIEFKPADDAAAKALLDAVTADSSPALATGIFEALAQSKAKGTGAAIVAKLKDLPPAARPAAVRLVVARTDSVKAFLDAVEKGTLRFDLLALDQRTALASHPDKDIAERTKKLLALGGEYAALHERQLLEEELALT